MKGEGDSHLLPCVRKSDNKWTLNFCSVFIRIFVHVVAFFSSWRPCQDAVQLAV